MALHSCTWVTTSIPQIVFALQSGIDPRRIDLNAALRLVTSTEAMRLLVGGDVYAPTARHTIVGLEPETGNEIWKSGWNPRRPAAIPARQAERPASLAAAELGLLGPFPSGMMSV